jgi:hypothetical protein
MSTAVLHVAADDSSTAIAAWLRTHHCVCRWCADAYEAVVVLRQAERPAELAFLATDRLTAEEMDLFPLIATAWPGTVVVAYGGGRLAAPAALPRGTIWCDTQAALDAVLRLAPAEIIRHASSLGASDGIRTASPGPEAIGLEAAAGILRSASADIVGHSRHAAAPVERA